MNRAEHLQWAKDRAIDLLERGETNGAFASFNSDMLKHKELEDHVRLELGMKLLLTGNLNSYSQMKEWIEGFN